MRTHGLRYHPLYKTWCEMRYRCEHPTKHNYKHYGGRGITVCARWSAFEDFVADMGERPAGATLDRIDTNGNYEPSNCRWATKLVQANNTRFNRRLTVNGTTKTLSQWALHYGLDVKTIWRRLKLGWEHERAVTRPVRQHKIYERAGRV